MNSLFRSWQKYEWFVLSDRFIAESTTIELTPVECERTDGSKFTYFKGEFDIIMAKISSEKEDK
jgi:hypothetical protein